MFQISAIGNNKLTSQTPYWDAPGMDLFDIYLDATRNGYRSNGVWSDNLGNLIADTYGGASMVEGPSGWEYSAAGALSRSTLGLQISPYRNNYVRNSSMAGASVESNTAPNFWDSNGTSTGITTSTVGVGTERGLPFTDLRFNGIATGTLRQLRFDSSSKPAAGHGPYTFSLFVKLLSGALPKNLRVAINEHDVGGSYLADTNGYPLQPGTGVQRLTATRTPSAQADNIVPYLKFALAVGDVVDFTIRLYCPQLELGVTATPPILTSNSVLERFANKPTIMLGDKARLGVAGFLQIEMFSGVQEERVLEFNNGGAQNSIQFKMEANGLRLVSLTNDANVGSANPLLPSNTGLMTVGFAYTQGFIAAGGLGSEVNQSSASGYPSVIDRVALGGNGYSSSSSNIAYMRIKKMGITFATPEKPINRALYDKIMLAAAEEFVLPPTIL